MTVDFDKIMNGIVDRGRVALERTTSYTLQRAQEHAPVRAIFDRSQNPRGPAFPKSFKTIRSEGRYQAFLRSKAKNKNIDSSSSLNREIRLPAARTTGELGEKEPIRKTSNLAGRRGSKGTSNSLFPVLGAGNNERVVGDFRSLRETPDVVRKRRGTRPRLIRSDNAAEFAARKGRGNPVERLRQSNLTSRGRYEVKAAFGGGRGNFDDRVGGRLRGELRKSQQVWRGNVLWQYVESPTPYAKYQEFGTSRHRPQPFLRPALYESRQRLRSEVRKISQWHQQTAGLDADTRGNVRMARQARDLGPKSNPLTGG